MPVGSIDYLSLFAAYSPLVGKRAPLSQLGATPTDSANAAARTSGDSVDPTSTLLGGAGEVAGLRERLDKAIATTDAALAGGDKAAALLSKLRDVAKQASNPELAKEDRSKLTTAFADLKKELSDTISKSGHQGTNLLTSDKATTGADTGLAGGGKIEVRGRDLRLGGDVVVLEEKSSVASAGAAEEALAAIDDSLGNVSDTLTAIGAGSDRLQSVRSFALNFGGGAGQATGETGLTLPDAQSTAAQVRKILGQSQTSIANGTPAALLSLFGQQPPR